MAIENQKVETKKFKLYVEIASQDEIGETKKWELQGRGIESWTIEENMDVEKKVDVLGFVDMERGTAQPTQSGVLLKLRKGSLLSDKLFEAWLTRDYSKLDSMKILQKFEFTGGEDGDCLARLEEDVMIVINNLSGEAGGYLGFEVDIHYANKTTLGTMPLVDGETITFTPISAA